MKWVLIAVGMLVALLALIALVGVFLPRDHRATSAVTLHQPQDSVWKVVRDLGGVPRWWPDVKSAERMADAAGREAWRQKSGGFDVPLVVTESQAPRRLVTEIVAREDAAFGGTWTYDLAPVDGGTRVSVTEAGWISNPIFRFLSRVVFGYYGTPDGYLRHLGRRFGEDVRPVHM